MGSQGQELLDGLGEFLPDQAKGIFNAVWDEVFIELTALNLFTKDSKAQSKDKRVVVNPCQHLCLGHTVDTWKFCVEEFACVSIVERFQHDLTDPFREALLPVSPALLEVMGMAT